MISLRVNADDFGYSNGVNYGILDTYKYGIVNSTTMLMNMPGTAHAIQIAKENPDLLVGIHLTLTCGSPLTKSVSSLTDSDGQFRMTKSMEEYASIKLDDVEKEWEAQIHSFLETGLMPSHLDSHHHVHGLPRLLPIVKRLSEKYQLPVRNVFTDRDVDLSLLTDVFFSDFFGENVTVRYFKELVNRVEDGQSVEVMCHPAYLDQYVLSNSSYQEKRVEELDILTKVKLSEKFRFI
ncbi:chitin disaccharide deacetylase [Pseudalkalibacillus sp. SCS-8]|uniref:chitin disaccharide deacetylase n=1 Tax=Pseudalkalibacillus nanhaiensis TaxID=3115291 RepID=UPI0032DBCE8C